MRAAPRSPEPVPRPRADFLAPAPNVRESLGAEAVINGKLSFSAPTRIDGKLRGEVRADDLLVIGEGGFVGGTIRAANLLVLGEVEGEVLGADRIEIGPRGLLRGAIEANALVVREGGLLDGDCRIATLPRGRPPVMRARPAEAGAPATGARLSAEPD
jgi:cytoskeletal protein CcmA (bactofilin family)